MLRGSVALGRFAGIEIRCPAICVVAFALVTLTTASGFFPASVPGFDSTAYWLMGASTALLFFASVLIHELSPSLVARARGYRVHRIPLFGFDGLANIDQPEKPTDEVLIAIAGPFSSFAL